jgi:hypothetical protein
MELPDDVLDLVRQFSRPITHPGWRGLHQMSAYRFHINIKNVYNEKNIPVINSFAERYDQSEYTYVFGQGRLFEPIVLIFLNKIEY